MNIKQQHTQSWTTANHTTVLEERGKGGGKVTNIFTFLHVFTFKALLKYLVTASS